MSDPHIDKADAKQLIKEIASSIRKILEDRFVLVSFSLHNSQHEKSLLPVFDSRIEVTNGIDNSKAFLISIKGVTMIRKETIVQRSQRG